MERSILSLEERLTRLEDMEAIRALTNKYHYAINERQLSDIWPLFTTDARMMMSDGVPLQGIDAIKAGLSEMLGKLSLIKQFIHSHAVEVNGVVAKANSFLDARYARHSDPTSYLVAGKLLYEYAKSENGWLISRYDIFIHFRVPVTVGWAGEKLIY